MGIKIKNEEQIELMREAGRIVALVHNELKKIIAPGISLIELNDIAEEIITKEGGIATFKGFDGYPKSICTSVNEVLVHGIPTNYKLQDGDVISVDVGVIKNGWNGDAAFTVGVGNIKEKNQKLIDVTREALYSAIKFAKPGVSLGELGAHIEKFAKDNKLSSTKQYVGHGIGETMHEDPFVPNYAFNGGEILEENMTICIEPMFIDGKDKLFTDPLDGWTVRTKHRGFTAHEEHTIVIRRDGGEILTKL